MTTFLSLMAAVIITIGYLYTHTRTHKNSKTFFLKI